MPYPTIHIQVDEAATTEGAEDLTSAPTELSEKELAEYKKFLGGARLPTAKDKIWSIEELTKGRFER